MISKVYPKYKPSGVEWLGDVPQHWGSLSLKWASIRYSGGTPDKTIQDYWEDGTIPWLNSGAVNDDYIVGPSSYITKEAFQNSSAKWIPKGALVMALAGQGKTKGMVAQLGFETTCNQSMAAIVPNKKLNPRMLYWWLTKNYINIRNLAGGEARDGLNLDMLGSIPIPLPPLPEQQAIAAFLDRETGRIDSLIAKKQKLLELLAEQRTALISRVVSKGLDSTATLKPSGVEWLGDVPEHWGVKKLKHVAYLFGRIGFRGYTTEDLVDEGEGAITLSPSNMKDGELHLENATYISWEKYYESPEIIIKPEDIVIVKTGSTLGKLSYVRKIEHPITLNPQLAVFKRIKCNNRFFFYYVGAPYIQHQISLSNTGSTIPTMTQQTIMNYAIPLPPLPEQEAIAAFLDRETAKIDALSAKVTTVIERLKEYRTALISSAVTGKIDVREAV